MQIDRSREGLWKWYLGLFIPISVHTKGKKTTIPFSPVLWRSIQLPPHGQIYSNMGNRNRHLHS